MESKITCIDNGGFEDMLTLGNVYVVEGVGENSYLVKDDNNVERWFGMVKFK